MKKNFLLLLIAFFPLSAMNEDSLKKCCLDFLLKNPREQIKADLEHHLPFDCLDDIRERWFSKLDKTRDWWRSLVVCNNPTIPLLYTVDAAQDIGWDSTHTSIELSLNREEFTYRCYYDLKGNMSWPSLFTPDQNFDVLDKESQKLYTLPACKKAIRSTQAKKIIGINENSDGFIYDYAPGEKFEEYIAERAPLAQILLLEAIRVAHEKGEMIRLTAQEEKILDGMPPQFEKAKDFLRKSVH